MILLKKCLLAFFGLCAGGIIAAGVYAFLAIIGVFVRLMGKTGTRKHIFCMRQLLFWAVSWEIYWIFMSFPFIWGLIWAPFSYVYSDCP